jgi:hypothetical protein
MFTGNQPPGIELERLIERIQNDAQTQLVSELDECKRLLAVYQCQRDDAESQLRKSTRQTHNPDGIRLEHALLEIERLKAQIERLKDDSVTDKW